jgi:exodeoxyribonuclease VII large subunit
MWSSSALLLWAADMMNKGTDGAGPTSPRTWQVGALCRAVADALDSRFNPVRVVGEITGFSRAASGHCYFSLKDANGQLRCAMFRRAAGALDFTPRDGELVEILGKLAVYEPRGELQLIVESLTRAGQGTLFEQFLQIKARLEKEGLFEPGRKRPLLQRPRAIGVVTSLGAAAWYDVVTALGRRVPHVPVILAPASVQGAGAAREMIQALEALYALSGSADATGLDVILLVRGGGAMEDLWAFNDEQLARTIAHSPVPVVCGVGHETDFTIADFVADLRAPTPTAAAELACQPTELLLEQLAAQEQFLQQAVLRRVDRESQKVDRLAARLGRPSALIGRQLLRLDRYTQAVPRAASLALRDRRESLELLGQRLQALDPQRVLLRGYAWIAREGGHPVTTVRQAKVGQHWKATLADGTVDLEVLQVEAD